MSKTRSHLTIAGIPKRWNALNDLRPLRPIHDDVDLDNATEIIDAMAGHDLTVDQDDYLDALATLVSAYESECHPVHVRVRGLNVLRSLLNDHAMTAADLARLLGVHRSHASKILKGDRSLTVEHLRKLSQRFKLRADVFIG